MTSRPTPLRTFRCLDVGAMTLVDQPPPAGVRGGRPATVTRWSSGAWSCTCGEFRSVGSCRHLAAVRRVSMFGSSGGVTGGA